ncbi:MAG: hypothetical protein Q8807_04175, partial ['Waltheria sp.' little leaf phytoplasma]|nr:hypothetical protein ['Waltheria sp.' little leaf phytoplasma]
IELSIIKEIIEIKGIGYRIVQGGELFPNSIILTDENLDKFELLASHSEPVLSKIEFPLKVPFTS